MDFQSPTNKDDLRWEFLKEIFKEKKKKTEFGPREKVRFKKKERNKRF